jgi:hypothetical protein
LPLLRRRAARLELRHRGPPIPVNSSARGATAPA